MPAEIISFLHEWYVAVQGFELAFPGSGVRHATHGAIEPNCEITYRNNPEYWDRQDWLNRVDPDQMPQNAASDQGLHCLPLIQQFLHTSTDSKLDLFKF